MVLKKLLTMQQDFDGKLLIMPDFGGEDYFMTVLHSSQNDNFSERLIKTTGVLLLRSRGDRKRPFWHTELELMML